MSVPKLHPTVRYAEPDYWDSRYEREPSLFEWFFGHTALRRIIRTYVSKKKTILQVGCGTSNMQEGMAKSGYNVVNTDISPVVIKQMKERHAQYPNLTYLVSDCRNMPEFRDCQFGHVIDKGTVDALLCSKQGTGNVFAMLEEIHRVLEPGGSFLLVTLGDPTRRLPLLFHPKLQWKVNLLLLPKISAAAQAYVDGKAINDSIKPIDADGPYEVLDANTIVGLPADVQYSNYFFAYVCKKPGLQLAGSQGQRVQLPANWVAGSKEVFQKLQKELGLPEDLLDKGRRKRVMHVPAGSKHILSAPGSTNSSNSSNAAAAAILGVKAVDIERVLQEDQLHFQELTASTPSVAGGQGKHGGQGAFINHLQPQQRPEQQQPASKGVADSGPASLASLPNLTQLESPDGLNLRALIERSPAPSRISNYNGASAVDAGSTAASPQPAAQAPATAEQMQQQQEYRPSSVQLDRRLATVTEVAPAGTCGDSASLHGSLLSGSPQDLAPGWSMCPAAPRAPRSQGNRVPKIRRFSTECSKQSFTASQPQLAVLRQQQAQHSERAADGLVMHDVPAAEAFGSTAMSAAALAAAVWGHTRSPRNRRFSNISTTSGMSLMSSVSTVETDYEGYEEGGGSGAEDMAPANERTIGDTDQQQLQQRREDAQQQDPDSDSGSEDGEEQHEQQSEHGERQQQHKRSGHGSTVDVHRSSSAITTTTSSRFDSLVGADSGHQHDQQQQQQQCSEVQGGEVLAQQRQQQQPNCQVDEGTQLQPSQASDDTQQDTAAPGIKEMQQQIAGLDPFGSPVAYTNGVVGGV